MPIKAGDTVRILYRHHHGETHTMVCKSDGLAYFRGIDGGIPLQEVELVRACATGNPCGTPCAGHGPRENCDHCAGVCQQPYGQCR